MSRELYETEVLRHVLALREALVRHDENLKAWQLLDEACPYFLRDHPDIVRARADQHAMVRHILDPAAYEPYYANNVHERPFEEQYGIQPEDAHKHLYRVQFLREGLLEQGAPDRALDVLDLSANDGWMAVNLGELRCHTDCLDLNPSNIALARKRELLSAHVGRVAQGDLHDAHEIFAGRLYDAVVCFETLEHVADPLTTMAVMRELVKPDGRLYVSTPFEAIEQGNVPGWAHVEPKGHVRAATAQDLAGWMGSVCEILRGECGPDRVMVMSGRPLGG